MQIPEKRKFIGKYDARLKIAIVREYLSSDLGYTGLSKKYNIPSTTISDFVKWYRKRYPDGTEGITEYQGPVPAVNRELQEAQLKITALEMLIENAGKELGVDLVKKFGTKQPKK